MNKKAVISKICAKTGVKKEVAESVLSALYDTILSALQRGEEVSFSAFGKFSTKQRAGRKYVSFQTGETFISPPHLVPVLKFSKQYINKF